MADRIPALVVSGFLGSGKTSTVRHLLADAQRSGVRMAVVSNEFGELGIDAALIGSRDEDYVELAGGCVCCRLSDELVETLQAIWERSRPDRIVIETSGVALPFETQLNLWRDPVRTWIGDDAAVVVVNAEQLAASRDLDDTFAQQVSSADLLLLNQIDRVSEAALPGLEDRLRELEPDAPIVRCTHGAVAPALLFPPDPDGARTRRREEPPDPPAHVHESFVTQVVDVAPGETPTALATRVRALNALRVKGFVQTSEGLRLIQAIGPRVDLTEPDAPPPPELVGRLVAIRRSGTDGSDRGGR